MTVCVAYSNPSQAWLGCDAIALSGDTVLSLVEKKLFNISGTNIHYVFCGDLGMRPVMHEVLKDAVARLRNGSDDLINPTHLSRDFRAAFRAEGWEGESSGSSTCPSWPAGMLITDGYTLWDLDSIMCVDAVEESRFAAIGVGADYALGAWSALKDSDANLSVEGYLTTTINAACTLSSLCGGRITVSPVVPEGRWLGEY